MAATTPSTALAAIQPTITDAERIALAGFLAGHRGLTREACTLDLRQFTGWCRARSLLPSARDQNGPPLTRSRSRIHWTSSATAAPVAALPSAPIRPLLTSSASVALVIVQGRASALCPGHDSRRAGSLLAPPETGPKTRDGQARPRTAATPGRGRIRQPRGATRRIVNLRTPERPSRSQQTRPSRRSGALVGLWTDHAQ